MPLLSHLGFSELRGNRTRTERWVNARVVPSVCSSAVSRGSELPVTAGVQRGLEDTVTGMEEGPWYWERGGTT